MDNALITLATIRNFRKVATNFDTDRLAGFIFDAQISNLRPLVGAALYADIIANYTPFDGTGTKDIWQKLVEGDAQFYGVQPYLAYFILAAMAREANTQITEKGFQMFSNAESSDSKDRREMESDYKNKANTFANEIINYLETNKAIYTSYISTNAPAGNGLNWFVL